MERHEVVIGTALLPVETLEGHERVVRLAVGMMKGWMAFTADSRESHEKALLQRQIVNLGEVAEFLQTVIQQHREWTQDRTGTDG